MIGFLVGSFLLWAVSDTMHQPSCWQKFVGDNTSAWAWDTAHLPEIVCPEGEPK